MERDGRETPSSGVFPLAFPLLAGPGAITTVFFSINSLGIPFSLIPVLAVMAQVKTAPTPWLE
ncbi:MAG: MarC family protein [Candidatus Caldarchaeum sp.]